MKKKKGKLGIVGSIISVILILAALGSCIGGDAETESAEQGTDVQAVEQETQAEAQTEEAAPDDQETADETTEPEQTEEATEKPEEVEGGPTEAEPIEPIVYTGSGDSVVTLDTFDDPYVFYIKGNDGENHFAVTSYDSDGNYLDLLVNTTEAYSGITIDPEQKTHMLEVTATGDWTIEQRSLYSVTTISSGETISGNGDDILLVQSHGSTAGIEGNSGENHFAVLSYGANGTDLLVNTTDAYSGTVMLKNDPIVLAVTAVGDWTITFND